MKLFSIFNIVNGQGSTYNQGELLRWLGENVWFPTNLLPNTNLQWTALDEGTAKLSFDYKGNSVFYIVTFNKHHEITSVETKRYMGETLETWIGKFSDYKELNDVLVPTTVEAIWKLKPGDYSYAKFTLSQIEYDHPEQF